MSELARGFYGQNPLIAMPIAALIFLAIVFAIAIVLALRADRSHVQRLSRLPLEGESSHE